MGERGQVVIPAEARSDMRLAKGDKLLVVGTGDSLMGFMKLDQLNQLAAKLTERLEKIRKIAQKTSVDRDD